MPEIADIKNHCRKCNIPLPKNKRVCSGCEKEAYQAKKKAEKTPHRHGFLGGLHE